MISLVTRRLGHSLLVLAIMSFAIYGLIGLMPGDPIDLMIAADPRLSSEDVARLKALQGLDQPLLARYGRWLAAALSGDLGYSRLFAKPVLETMAGPLANTLALAGLALFLSLAAGLPLGLAAALKPRSAADHAINLFAFATVSLPVFWVGLLGISLFAVTLGWLPASGVHEVGGGGFSDRLRHLILPASALALPGIGQYARYMRAALLETLSQDYIRTARAKGAGPWRVLTRHALRNALIPVVTVLALEFGSLFSGVLITETVFAYPGMGKLIFDSVMGNDFNLALAALLLTTFVTLLGNLLADLAYAWLDPRIGYR